MPGQCILPLQPIAGNFAKVLAALGELKALAKPAFGLSHSNSSKGCLLEGLQEAMAQFKCATTQGPKQVKETKDSWLSIAPVD